jgi:hypothetical protein
MRPAATRAAKAARLRAQVWSRWICMSRWAAVRVNGCGGGLHVESFGQWSGSRGSGEAQHADGYGQWGRCVLRWCGLVPRIAAAGRRERQGGEGRRPVRVGHRQPRASRTTAHPVRTVTLLDNSSHADIGFTGITVLVVDLLGELVIGVRVRRG